MTSSNGNIFRVTGHLCGEFTGPQGNICIMVQALLTFILMITLSYSIPITLVCHSKYVLQILWKKIKVLISFSKHLKTIAWYPDNSFVTNIDFLVFSSREIFVLWFKLCWRLFDDRIKLFQPYYAGVSLQICLTNFVEKIKVLISFSKHLKTIA